MRIAHSNTPTFVLPFPEGRGQGEMMRRLRSNKSLEMAGE